MSRWPALLLAIVGGAVGAWFAVIGGTAVLAGILWLYVFGDDPWPSWAETILNLAIPLVGFFLWGLFGWIIWKLLRRRPA